MVEIHSPTDLCSEKEREAIQKKIADWQVVGVRIIWSINSRQKSVEVYHLGQARPIQTLGENDELSGKDVILGFSLRVSELFSG